MLIQLTGLKRGQTQTILPGNINDCLRADRTLQVAVDFRLGNVVVSGIEVFHNKSPCYAAVPGGDSHT
jgi:hypothetical protein